MMPYRPSSFPLAVAGLAAACALMALPAQASKWETIVMNEQGLFYIDAQSIRKEGPHTSVWTLLDYKKPQTTADGKAFLSTKSQIMFNCRMKMARIMHMTYFSGAMLDGKEVYKQGMLHDWLDIEPGTPVQRIARRVC